MKQNKIQYKPKSSRASTKKPKGLRATQGRKKAPVSSALRNYSVRPPVLSSRSAGATMVRHREFIQDVAGSVAFASVSLPINAGRDTLFTWLSELAARYEEYHFTALRMIYEPRCSTATAGSVILAVDFDALDPAPANKQDVYSYHRCSQSSAWDENCYLVDPAILRSRGPLKTRVGAIPANADLKTYDLGNLFLCTSGFVGTDVVGELFVEYDVVLSIPQLADNTQSGYSTATAGLSGVALFGTGVVFNGNLDRTYTSASTVTLNQNWEGVVSCQVNGTGLAAGGFVSSGTVACALVNEMYSAAGTSGVMTFRVPAASGLRGRTIVLAITATTVTATTMYWSAYQS